MTNDQAIKMKALCEEALSNYHSNPENINAGWNCIRYMKQGYVKIRKPFASDFLESFHEWYPGNFDFVILKMAKEGKLYVDI